MENLNNDFLNRMQKLLKNDYEIFLKSLDEPPISALRVNTLFCKREKIKDIFPHFLQPLNFYDQAFLIKNQKHGFTSNPLHLAGYYYIQEPSAMVAPLILNPKKTDRVLDLCASPGGKATQIAAMMNNKGILVVNEYNNKRVKTLISNIERMGVENAIVYSKRPDKLALNFKDYFDKILVDAPCSGEGMFRKNKEAIRTWSVSYSNGCSKRQLEILDSAAKMCAKDGIIVYSTCTFSREENEDVIEKFLLQHDDFELLDANVNFGRSCDILGKYYGRRVYPFEGGEGAFVSKLKKISGSRVDFKENKCKTYEIFSDFVEETFEANFKNVIKQKDKFYILPNETPKMPQGYIRAGIMAGQEKRGRFVPAHHLFKCNLSFKEDKVVNLSSYSPQTADFMHGNVIKCGALGYCCVKVDGVPLGFGKGNGEILKNFYPKGLRI